MIVSMCFVVLGLMGDEGVISHACNVVISSHMLAFAQKRRNSSHGIFKISKIKSVNQLCYSKKRRKKK